MTVVAQATIVADAFDFGEVLQTNASAEIELTQLVSLNTEVIPYFWVSTDETNAFEDGIREDPRVDRLIRHDEQARKTLYHIEWATEIDGFLLSAQKHDIVVERGAGTVDKWTFRLRATDQSTLRSFYHECHERGLPVRMTQEIELVPEEADETGTSTGSDGTLDLSGGGTGTVSTSVRRGVPTDELGDESPFREIVENLDEVIWMSDPDKEVMLYVNPAYEEVWGRARNQLYEEPLSFLDAIHPDDRERVRAALEAQPAGDYDETYRIVRPDGGVRWIHDRAVAIRNEAGNVYRVAGFAEDITQRTERERELDRTSQTLDALSASFPDPAFVIDEDGYFRESLAGPEAKSLLAAASEDLIGAQLRDVLSTGVAGRIRSVIRHSLDTGDLQTIEYQLDLPEGTRWFEARVTPMQAPAQDTPRVVFVARDVTERKQREHILTALHRTTGNLFHADTPQQVAEITAEAAREILGYPNNVVRLADEEGERLLPVAVTETAQMEMGERPVYSIDDTPVGEVYREGEPAIYEDISERDDGYDRGCVRGVMYLPVGSHGTISIADTEPSEFDQTDVELAQILTTNAAAALDRIDRRERLKRQNERLLELSRLNSLIRSIHGAVADATTRKEIATAVCETLVQNDPYVATWIGEYRSDRQVAVHAVAGAIDEAGAGPGIPAADDSLTDALVGTTQRPRSVKVMQDIQDGMHVDPWHEPLLDQGCLAAVSIPLTAGEATYGVLVLYADQADAFNQDEVTILQELGQMIGRAIRAVETRRALVADSAIELEFGVTDLQSFFVTASEALNCRLSLEGIVPLEGDRFLYYVTIEGTSPDALRERAATVERIESCRVISETEEGTVFEFQVSGASAVRVLMDYGATVRSAVADRGEGRIVAEVPQDTDVRTVLDGLREVCPGAELLRKQTLDRPVQTVQQFRKRLTEELTEKQLNALRTAYFAGYFEWPRESTAEEIAEPMQISSSTFHFHLRHALHKLLETFLELRHTE